MSRSIHQKRNLKRLRSLLVTMALVIVTNIAISYGANGTHQKSGVSMLPDSPRPKSGVSMLPDSPRPKSGVSMLPDSPRPQVAALQKFDTELRLSPEHGVPARAFFFPALSFLEKFYYFRNVQITELGIALKKSYLSAQLFVCSNATDSKADIFRFPSHSTVSSNFFYSNPCRGPVA